MMSLGAKALILGSIFSAAAGAAHLACIFIGASAYRFMGAGERIARNQPTLVTLAISAILLIWAAYALSGAGLMGRLPFTKLALTLITAIYLGRAVGFPLLKPVFPDNSQTFWIVSSSICLVIGLVHFYGLVSRWDVL